MNNEFENCINLKTCQSHNTNNNNIKLASMAVHNVKSISMRVHNIKLASMTVHNVKSISMRVHNIKLASMTVQNVNNKIREQQNKKTTDHLERISQRSSTNVNKRRRRSIHNAVCSLYP